MDYCGLEILDVSDPARIALVSWWNPWRCETNPFNWLSSPGHANEIEYDRDCKRLFLATGKSDLHVVDVSNPALPDSCASFGSVDSNLGTWGVGVEGDRVYLSYACAVIPFFSRWTGFKVVTFDPCWTPVTAAPWSRVKSRFR